MFEQNNDASTSNDAKDSDMFHLHMYSESEKLVGTKNFPIWKNMVEEDLQVNGLLSFVESDRAADIEIDEKTCKKHDARVSQIIRMSCSSKVQPRLPKNLSAFQKFKTLYELFSNSRAVEFSRLIKRLKELQF